MNACRHVRQGLVTGALLLTFAVAGKAHGESHAYITGARSSQATYVYLQENAEVEYNHYRLLGKDGTTSTESWQGSGLTTSLGTELWRFLQLEAGYSSMAMHKAQDRLDRLTGSRLHGGLRLDFNAPLFNLELGGGLTGTSFDYANHEETASFYGTGNYLSVGINYFLMSHVSLFGEVKYVSEHMKNTAGSGSISTIDSDSTAGGLGFRIWF